MFFRTVIAFLLLTLVSNAQTLIVQTNLRSTVSSPTTPAFNLSGPSGPYRITYVVQSVAGVPIPLDDGSTFRQYVYASDGHLVQSNANNLTADISLAAGQVKFLMSSLPVGEYRVRGIVLPVNGDTNAQWNFTHHTLTVTSSVSSACTTINVTNQNTIGAVTVTNIFGDTYITNITSGATINVTNAPINNYSNTTIIQLDNIISEVIYSNNYYFSGIGELSPYIIPPESPVTVHATNSWWQVLTTTGATEILIADKTATNIGASVRLDLWTLHATTITNIEGYASLAISTSAVNVLLFDNPADRGITNWYVEQLYP